MKKIFVLLLSVFVVMNVFATTGTTEESVGDSKATLKLTLENKYKLAFIASPDITSEPKSEFTLKTTGNALTMSGEGTTLRLHDTQNVFYFYYQAYTNQDNLIITISADDLKNEDFSETIKYKASFVTLDKWDGDTLSHSYIISGSNTTSESDTTSESGTTSESEPTSASAKIKSSSTLKDYNYMGLCKVTITSDEDLGKKKPGIYRANIYLTLTAN